MEHHTWGYSDKELTRMKDVERTFPLSVKYEDYDYELRSDSFNPQSGKVGYYSHHRDHYIYLTIEEAKNHEQP